MFRRGVFAVAALAPLLSAAPAFAFDSCKEGELCTLQSEQFGCKDLSELKRWIDINIEIDRAAGDKYLADQVQAGQCAQFKTGDRLRIVHYMGMRRLEVQRAGQTERFIILLR